jgi:hypothetical protein
MTFVIGRGALSLKLPPADMDKKRHQSIFASINGLIDRSLSNLIIGVLSSAYIQYACLP